VIAHQYGRTNRMRTRLGTLLLLTFAPGSVALLSQTPSSSPLPPGFVDGSKHPEQIADYSSYRLVLLSLSLPASPTPRAISHRNSRIRQIGLSDADAQSFKVIVDAFGTQYSQWLAGVRTRQASVTEQTVRSLVLATRDSIVKSLTPDGVSKVAEYVERAKTHMAVKS
jgi:hypothetical protein